MLRIRCHDTPRQPKPRAISLLKTCTRPGLHRGVAWLEPLGMDRLTEWAAPKPGGCFPPASLWPRWLDGVLGTESADVAAADVGGAEAADVGGVAVWGQGSVTTGGRGAGGHGGGDTCGGGGVAGRSTARSARSCTSTRMQRMRLWPTLRGKAREEEEGGGCGACSRAGRVGSGLL